MMSESVRVTFQPEGRSVYVLAGSLLIEAAGKAGIPINAPCGGKGVCGKCRVVLIQGASPPTEECLKHISAEDLDRGVRLACRMLVTEDAVVEIPRQSRFFAQKILTQGEGQEVALEPDVRKYHVNLPEPSLEDQRADNDRLIEAIQQPGVIIPLGALKDLPSRLREANYDVTAVVVGDELLCVEPGDTTAANYGMAFDIGTTTVVGILVDLAQGRDVAVASRTNPQVVHGDDVINRIGFFKERGGGRKLQARIIESINEIAAECCQKAGVDCRQVYEITVAGNTTMNHLLLGIDPTYVAEAPYVAALQDALDTPAIELGVSIHPRGNVHTLPNIAGFVGGDTVGLILATDMLNTERMTLAIDIGTNGEIVAGNRERLVSCSTAAGPAFEGARIQFGMRAAAGAIDKVVFDSDVQLNCIENRRPRGICGTAVIDVIAEMLRVGVLDRTGRIRTADECPDTTPDAIRRRITPGENGPRLILANDDETDIDGPIFVTQRDVRELQLAKGAIAAGTRILLSELGVGVEDLDQILLAGAFGNFIRRNMAKRIGLLPDAPGDRVRYVGNAAGAGARMAILSRRSRDEAGRIAEFTEYLELGGRPDFQMEFMSAMMFPE